MKRFIATAFALSLLSGAAANAQQQDDQHHRGMGGGRQGSQGAPQAQAPAQPQAQAPAAPQGQGGRFQGGQGAAPAGPQSGPLFGSRARQPNQGWQQGQAPQQGYLGRNDNRGQEHDNYRNQGRGNDRGANPGGQAWGGQGQRDYQRGQDGRHEWNADRRFRGPAYSFPRGFGYRAWSFGQFLPSPFFSNNYTLYDYWNYGLSAPPYGFEWVRVGNDALLVRPADGYILDVARNLFW